VAGRKENPSRNRPGTGRIPLCGLAVTRQHFTMCSENAAATMVVRSSAVPRLVGVCRVRVGKLRDLLMWPVGATADLESAGMPRRMDGLGTR